MLRKTPFITVLLVAALGVLALSGCASPAVAQPTSETPHTISVTGNGVAYGTPDLATVQIGVQSRSPDAGQAVDENTGRMNALVAALKGLGLEEKDIQTTNFSVYPQQDYDPQTGQPTGKVTYIVDNTVSLTVRDLNQVGEVLGQATGAGANNIYGISFGVSDPAKLEADARAKAMADAKARAEQLAQAAGVTLDTPMTISEYLSGGPIPYAVDNVALADGRGSAAPVPVSAGQLQVNMQVNVTYIIK
jgi:uncharacterized protein YggE